MRSTSVWALLLATSGSLALAADAEPQLTPEQLRIASSIMDDTWSPFCPHRTLSSCTSGQAGAWREDIRRWLAEGHTREQIIEKLQERVPGFTLNTIPDTDGIRYGPWVLGALFAVVLAVLAVIHSRRSSKVPPQTRAEPASAPGGRDRRLLDAQLAALDD